MALLDGKILEIHADEGSGSSLADSIGERDGTASGAYEWSGGGVTPQGGGLLSGDSIKILGSDGRVDLPAGNYLGAETSWTVSVWVMLLTGITAYPGICLFTFDNNNNGFVIGNRTPVLFRNDSSGGVGTNEVLDLDKWYHLVGTWDGVNRVTYINAVESNGTYNDNGYGGSGNRLGIGYGGASITAKIDELCVWNRALSAEEVAELYFYQEEEEPETHVYPQEPNLEEKVDETVFGPEVWNEIVDNINAIGEDLVEARGDGQDFPGTDHSAEQSTNLADALNAIRHIIKEISGETNWYDAPAGSLKSHNHGADKGGQIPCSNLGSSGARSIYHGIVQDGYVVTASLHGAAASGNNNITLSVDIDVVSYVAHQYYQGISSQASLHDYYVAVRFTVPTDFGSWASDNAIKIGFRTGSSDSADCHVDVYLYKSGNGTVIATSTDNTSVNWSDIVIDNSDLGTWSPSDIMEIYIKLESRNNNYARVDRIEFNYNAG